MALVIQITGTILLCYSCLNMGIIQAWPSSTLLLFKSADTPLHRPMSDTEISLFGSLPAIGALIANPLSGLVIDRLGRKKTVLCTSMIFVIAWSVISLSKRVEVILTTMLISGMGFALFLQTTMYISEICQDSIRGMMTAGPMQFYNSGFLVSYFLGACLSYWQMVYVCLISAVMGVLMILVLKESPLTFMAAGREEDAAKSIAYYRSNKADSREVLQEVDKLRLSFKSYKQVGQILTMIEKDPEPTLIAESKKPSCWQFFKNSKSTQRELLLIIILQIAFVFQGMPIMMVYAEPLFAMTVPSNVISPSLCSILTGVVTVIFGAVAAYLTDVVGRRPLVIYASVLAGFSLFVLGTQILTGVGPIWIIPLFIYIFVAFYTIGAGTVPMVVLAEVFLPEVKSIISVLAIEWAWILYFLILFLFNLLQAIIGLAPMFYFFSFVCITTSVFFFYFMPETKGLPVFAIQELFIR